MCGQCGCVGNSATRWADRTSWSRLSMTFHMHLLLMEIRDMVSVFQRDQPAIPTTAIPTPLPPVTLGFRQFWLGLACVGIAVCIPLSTWSRLGYKVYCLGIGS